MGTSEALGLLLPLPQACWLTLGKSLPLSVSQFPHLYNRDRGTALHYKALRDPQLRSAIQVLGIVTMLELVNTLHVSSLVSYHRVYR